MPEAQAILSKRPCGAHHRWCVVIDTAASSRSVTIKLIGQISTLLPPGVVCRVCVIAGPGVSTAGIFAEALGSKFAQGRVSDTKVVNAASLKAEYVVTALIGDSNEDVCQTCDVIRYRCGPQDHATTTCTNKDCPGICGEDANTDLNPEDIAGPLEKMMKEAFGSQRADGRLWTVCRPVEWYQTVLREVAKLQDSRTVFLISSTASPNSILAARQIIGTLQWTNVLIVLFHRVSAHQLYHSRETLLEVLTEEAFTASQRKRKYIGTQYIQVSPLLTNEIPWGTNYINYIMYFFCWAPTPYISFIFAILRSEIMKCMGWGSRI